MLTSSVGISFNCSSIIWNYVLGVSWRVGGAEGIYESKKTCAVDHSRSPLINETDKFTCAQLEVYKVIYS